MKIQPSIKVLVYICLLIGGFSFVWVSIEGYLEGNTFYLETREELTLNDLPTISVCFVLTYGHFHLMYRRDMIINVTVKTESQSENTTLNENEYVEILGGLQLKLTELFQSMDQEQQHKDYTDSDQWWYGTQWQCYHISPLWNGTRSINLQELQIKLQFVFYVVVDDYGYSWTEVPNDAIVWCTSQDNSYGLTGGKMV